MVFRRVHHRIVQVQSRDISGLVLNAIESGYVCMFLKITLAGFQDMGQKLESIFGFKSTDIYAAIFSTQRN